MSYEKRVARIDRFAGLSDRSHPATVTRIENPKSLNVDYSDQVARRRYAYTRVNTERLKDASLRLDGYNDYVRIKDQPAYQSGGANTFYVGIGVVLRDKPPAATPWTIVQRGNDAAAANNHWKIQYDSSTATNPNGAWVFSMYDPTTPATWTVEIADGDGANSPIDEYRFVEMWVELVLGLPVFAAIVWKADSTNTIGTPVGPVLGGVTSTEDIVVGVNMATAGTIGTNFANITICELRYSIRSIATITDVLAANVTYGDDREIRELNPLEYSLYTGYWKFNDGTQTASLKDWTTTGNNAIIPANPAAWVSTTGEVLGPYGLQFFGYDAFVGLWQIGATGSLTNPFSPTAGQAARWTVRGIFVPKLATGETTVRDQCIFWAGTNATTPHPVALQISANSWLATYHDGAGTVTRTIGGGATPTTLVGKRVRFALSRHGTGNGIFRLALSWVDINGVQQFASSETACGSATPNNVSQFWHLGRHVTSVALPYTYGTATTDKGAFGVIDDFQVVHTNSLTAAPVSHGNTFAFQEKAQWGAPHFVVAHMRMNEGGGNFCLVTSELPQSFVGFIYPEENDGALWDVGYVRPYRSPECGGIFPFNRFLANGSIKRTKLIVSGNTLYDYDESGAGVFTAVGALPAKAATRWTKDQYAQTAFLAGDNGCRPIKYDGTSLVNLGIRAPLSAPVLTDGAGGTFTGTYYFYVTFFNKHKNVESNPGPGVAYTYAARTITQVVIPVSSDPQVTGRRLYCSLAGGAEGSLSFMIAEFDDNRQVTWGAATSPFTLTTITGPAISGRELVFLDREEAPIGSLVRVFGDNLFVSGDPVFPTRDYRSSVGEPDYFNQQENFVDLDLDSGDPITAMSPLVDSLFVGLRDGWGRVWNTGDSSNPIGKAIMSRDHGPVGPHAAISVDRLVYYMGELDIYRTNGLADENISSPQNPFEPSIQETMRSAINTTRKQFVCMAHYKKRKQIWVTYSSSVATRNDKVLVYNIGDGKWSDYELPMDFIAELEDNNDNPVLYGYTDGYLCKLDVSSASSDGNTILTKLVVATYTGGDAPYITYSGAALGAGAHGCIAFAYRKATNDIRVATCEYSQTTGVLRFYKSDLSLAASDVVIVGAIRTFMDWVLDFGESINLKRLRRLLISGKSTSNDTFMRLQWIKHQAERTPSFTLADQQIKNWRTEDDLLRFELGGVFRTVRLRLSECDDATGIFSSDAWPSRATASTIYELLAEAEVMDVD